MYPAPLAPCSCRLVQPPAAPPYRDYVGDEYNLRGCQCKKDWKSLPAEEGLCRCGGVCPSHVNPPFLTEAKGQALCSLDQQTGYKCWAACEHTMDDAITHVKWFAAPCGSGNQDECDKPVVVKAKPSPPPAPPAAAKQLAAVEKPAAAAAPAAVVASPTSTSKAEPPTLVAGGELTWDPKEVWDMRGLQCQMKDGKERCYVEDTQGRELCPEFVTHEWLSTNHNQWLCSDENADKYYCVAGCQEGNAEIKWSANEIKWCYDPKNFGTCPLRPTREWWWCAAETGAEIGACAVINVEVASRKCHARVTWELLTYTGVAVLIA